MKITILLFLLALATPASAQSSKKTPGPKDSVAGSLLATNNPVELEYQRLLALDDVAQKEVDKWIKEEAAFDAAGAGIEKAELALKVRQRLGLVKDAYEKFLASHPGHVEARLAYGSFLMDIQEDSNALVQMEKARELDPKNPAAWNNLANHYGHRGPVRKAFAYYEKAIELDPNEAVYRQNLATTTYLFRKDAQEFYGIDEQKVFDRALDLYQQALRLDPTNLVMAVDYAQTYYGIKPFRTNEALLAWTNALPLAKTSDEKQGLYIHLARVEMAVGLFDQAREHLNLITNPEMDDIKKRLEKNWVEKRDKALGLANSAAVFTNTLPAKVN